VAAAFRAVDRLGTQWSYARGPDYHLVEILQTGESREVLLNLADPYSWRLFDLFYELGGRGFDTALIYHNAEDLLGEWLKVNGIRDAVINAKGGHHEGWRPRLDRDALFADLRKTLDRLGVDHIDIFTLHRDDRDRPADTILETLYGLVEEGLIESYGTSN
jgi:aryl-alcohol dehydrogenase-like predicted oxidoreductase